MDEANSKIATSNLIILSPKDLAKLGLNLILSNAKNKNRKNEESCTNHQLKKKKHPTRKNIQMSKSDPRDELSANESVDSNMDMISEGILDGNEPISLEPHRGKPRTTKSSTKINDSCNESPSTSEFLNTPQTRKKMPKNNIHKVSFQKPFSNSKAAKNASIKSTLPNVEKLENNLIPLKKLKPRKSNKKTCLIQPEPSLVENSISYKIEKMHQEPCKLIENDLDNSKAISPYQKKKLEESKNQEDIETLPERHESLPILDQESKTSRTNNSSCDDMEIDIVKNNRSSLTKVSPSPTKKMEESKNQENIETLPERHESLPILDQESKTSRTNISLCDEMEIDIVKNNRSSLTKVSPSPTNKLEESKNQEDIETPPERHESLPILDQESKTSRTNNSSCDDMEIDIVKNNRSSLTKRHMCTQLRVENTDDLCDNTDIENKMKAGKNSPDVELNGSHLNTEKIGESSYFTKKRKGRPKKIKVSSVADVDNECLEPENDSDINKSNKEYSIVKETEDLLKKQIIKCNSDQKKLAETTTCQRNRGRRKNQSLEYGISNVSCDDLNEKSYKDTSTGCSSVECPDESKTNINGNISNYLSTSTSLRKRDRKRKNDLSVSNQNTENTVEDNPTGNKRRMRNRNSSVPIKVASFQSLLNESEITVDTEQENTATSENNPLSIDAIEKGENVRITIENAATDDADLIALEKTPPPPTKAKYTFHGRTSQMINSIFSAAFKSNDGGVVADNHEQLELPVNTAKNIKGRPRLNDNNIISDGDGNALCVICETKIPYATWEDHNKSKHYSLAWCKGQDIVPMDDERSVKKILKFGPRKQFKLKCYKCDHTSTTVHSHIVHYEECRGILLNGVVVCAVCNTSMDRAVWLSHKLKHNNLAWRIGDVPMDLNDQSLVMSVLNALYKAKKPLNCEKCGTTKKSVVGYISHLSQCGVDTDEALVQCELCSRKMLPVSMTSHLKGYHGPKQRKSDNFNIDLGLDAPLKKRKAAEKALSKFSAQSDLPLFLQQMNFKEHSFVVPLLNNELNENGNLICKFKNCDYQIDNVEALQDHLAVCSLKPNEYFVCTKCLSALSQGEKQDHVEKCREILSSDDEYIPLDLSDEEKLESKHRKHKSNKTVIIDGVEEKTIFRSVPRCIKSCQHRSKNLFPSAFKDTFDFCQIHFNQPNLFNNLRYSNHDWCLLDEELMDKYLPKMTKSCRVAFKRVKNETGVLKDEPTFKELELFEHTRDARTTTLFCGGPISALAWQPTPFNMEKCNQILAVATYMDFDEKYSSFKYYNEPSLIQFWNFGMLRNKMETPEPKLHFGLAVDFGPIWNMEWCPSGCFDEKQSEEFELHRIGVLAISGTAPSVYIFAIPFLPDDQTNLIYKVKPLLKLQLVLDVGDMKRETYPSKLSWSRAQGHKHLAVGYTDGTVGIFDLATDSQLLKFKDEEGLDVILPYKVIKAHKHCITALTLIHLKGGARWLFTGSFDRCTNVWDLNNDTSCVTPMKKMISDGTWLTNWVTYLTASDESGSVNAITNGYIHAHRNYLSEPMTMLRSHSTISSISFNDWLNACLQCSTGGDICIYLPSQLLYSFDSVRSSTFRYYLNTTYLIDTTKSTEERLADHKKKQPMLNHFPKKMKSRGPVEMSASSEVHEPLIYKNAIDKYGILFCDFTRDKIGDFPPVFHKKPGDFACMKQSFPDMYSLQALTKTSFNPNCFSSLYFATGYQAGFVRLNYLKFLENDAQVQI